MSDDEVAAAAARLLASAEAYIAEHGNPLLAPNLYTDAFTVARYALEAGQEAARLTADLVDLNERLIATKDELAYQAKNAAEAHRERAHQQRRATDALEENGRLQDELHVYHAREALQWSKTAPEMDDCPRCAALSTPGEPESSGGA